MAGEPVAVLGPLTFRPILKQARWGGSRLSSLLNKAATTNPDCAESWEVADHPDGQSVVADGPWQDHTLAELLEQHGELLLGRHAERSPFPLLIKFLDVTDRLSLQVHPDDEYATRQLGQANGKTEAWVVLQAEADSRLWVGLTPGTTRRQLATALVDGALEDCLHGFPATPGQCVLVPAGTVHAIGQGIVLAEFQQTSNLTFRLHDWQRLGRDGQPRRLQVEEALECIDYDRGPLAPVTPLPLSGNGNRHLAEQLVECPYFSLRRHLFTPPVSGPITLHNDNRCRILVTVSGTGSLAVAETTCELAPGCTVLLPASVTSVEITATTPLSLLETFLPGE